MYVKGGPDVTKPCRLQCCLSSTRSSGIHINSLQRCHNERDSFSNHQRLNGLLNRLFRRRSKETSKLRVTGLCGGIHRSPHKGPVTRKMFPLDDVIMYFFSRNYFVMNYKIMCLETKYKIVSYSQDYIINHKSKLWFHKLMLVLITL